MTWINSSKIVSCHYQNFLLFNAISNCHQLKRVELFDCQLITKAGTRKLRVTIAFYLVILFHSCFSEYTPRWSVAINSCGDCLSSRDRLHGSLYFHVMLRCLKCRKCDVLYYSLFVNETLSVFFTWLRVFDPMYLLTILRVNFHIPYLVSWRCDLL